VIFPLLVAPHTLLHDMVILVPAFVLLSIYQPLSRNLLVISIVVYFGTFFLTLLGALTNVAWVSLLTIGIVIIYIYWITKDQQYIFSRDRNGLVD
jgi:hypothetical protein